MVGRQSLTHQTSSASWNNGSNTSGSRRGRTSLERDGETSSSLRVGDRANTNGRPTQQHSQLADEGSDIDELIDSDTERAEMDELAKSKAVARSTPGGGGGGGGKGPSRSRGKGGTATISSKASPRPSSTLANSEKAQQPSERQDSAQTNLISIDSAQASSSKNPPTPQPRESSSSSSSSRKTETIPNPAIAPASSSSSKGPLTMADVRGHDWPEVQSKGSMTGRNGSPVYYPPPSSNDFKVRNQSPRDGQFRKSVPPPFSGSHVSGSKADAGSKSVSITPSEDLNLQEVDKFLDLIEKHNLHTSNEDDMARSVTELYQEWLEWCAKRSVVSTKSKQALVAEFVRIHQGDYGRTRQQRAMDIVKGSAGQEAGEIGGGGGEGGRGGRGGINRPAAFEGAGQPMPMFPPLAKSAPSSRNVSRFKEEERGDQQLHHHAKSLSSSTGTKRVVSGGSQGPYIHVPSPSLAPRARTPGSTPAAAYNDGYGGPNASDTLYRQVREDVWRDASIMIGRLIHEQMAEVLEENSALRGRVEQLEIHSDNLAQWVQHLNRVQDDLSQSVRSTGPPPPSLHLRQSQQQSTRDEMMMMDEQNAKFGTHHSHRSVGSNHHDRNYGPPPTYLGDSSPKRSYSIRRSPSPPLMGRFTRRPIDSPQSQIQSIYQPLGDARDFHSGGSHGGHSRVPLSDPYDRPYYAYSPDAPPPPPPLPSSHSPHQSKRARNGY